MKEFLPCMVVLFGTISFVMLLLVMGTFRTDALVCWMCSVVTCLIFISLTKSQNEKEKMKRDRSHFEWRKKCGVERF